MEKYIVVGSQLNHVSSPTEEFLLFGSEVEFEDGREMILGNTCILPEAEYQAIADKHTAEDIAAAKFPGNWGPVAPPMVRECWIRLHELREAYRDEDRSKAKGV